MSRASCRAYAYFANTRDTRNIPDDTLQELGISKRLAGAGHDTIAEMRSSRHVTSLAALKLSHITAGQTPIHAEAALCTVCAVRHDTNTACEHTTATTTLGLAFLVMAEGGGGGGFCFLSLANHLRSQQHLARTAPKRRVHYSRPRSTVFTSTCRFSLSLCLLLVGN